MTCLGCVKLEANKNCVTLISGKIVCNYCQDYLIECEAIGLLNLPLERRQELLEKFEKKRGDISALKQAMTDIFNSRKVKR